MVLRAVRPGSLAERPVFLLPCQKARLACGIFCYNEARGILVN
jgi:hypothetical protein